MCTHNEFHSHATKMQARNENAHGSRPFHNARFTKLRTPLVSEALRCSVASQRFAAVSQRLTAVSQAPRTPLVSDFLRFKAFLQRFAAFSERLAIVSQGPGTPLASDVFQSQRSYEFL